MDSLARGEIFFKLVASDIQEALKDVADEIVKKQKALWFQGENKDENEYSRGVGQGALKMLKQIAAESAAYDKDQKGKEEEGDGEK